MILKAYNINVEPRQYWNEWNSGNIRVAVLKSLATKGDFGHFRSSKEHADWHGMTYY